jgi:hypothetical protein
LCINCCEHAQNTAYRDVCYIDHCLTGLTAACAGQPWPF